MTKECGRCHGSGNYWIYDANYAPVQSVLCGACGGSGVKQAPNA